MGLPMTRSKRRKGFFVLRKPINFTALAEGYKLAGWKWSSGPRIRKLETPSAYEIRQAVQKLEGFARSERTCYASGGITVCVNEKGKTAIAVDKRLISYLPLRAYRWVVL